MVGKSSAAKKKKGKTIDRDWVEEKQSSFLGRR